MIAFLVMKLSTRANRLQESATLAVSRRAAELRSKGVDVLSFGAGEPDFSSPQLAIDAAIQALKDGMTRYTACAGTPELRSALAERYHHRYGAPWSANRVMVTVGAKAALFELAMVLFEAGDEVIVPSPAWVSFDDQIRFADASVVSVPTDPNDGFALRAAPLLAAVTSNTKAILVNSPCNPTGGLMEEAELEQLIQGAAQRGIRVIADETYEMFLYDGRQPVSAASFAADFPETVILVGSFSKLFAMTGWRVGYTFGPSVVIGAVQRLQSHLTSNVTSFAMAGALAALQGAEKDFEPMRAEYEARRNLVVRGFAEIEGFSCQSPAGAFYAFPKVSQLYGERFGDSVSFSTYLLEKAHVAVVPGSAFGADEHVRLSFACSRNDLEVGLERIAAALA